MPNGGSKKENPIFEDKTSIVNCAAISVTAKQVESRSACFIVIAGGQIGRMYKLERGELVLGRSVDAGIHLDDEGVSRLHAKISLQPDSSVVLEDLGSTNGTFCNGERITTRVLHDGDKLQIGTTSILKFSYQDTLEEDFQRRQYESATRDPLTGCYNKKYLLERLPSEIAFAKRHGKLLSFAMLDLDHFKRVNDTHGHPAGDFVLRRAAAVMQETIRADDTLARYGGEEFALIMRETAADAAFIAVERIRRKIEATDFNWGDVKIPVTVSAGVATWTPTMSDDPSEIIRAADEFLYKAKRSGRNRTEGDAVGP